MKKLISINKVLFFLLFFLSPVFQIHATYFTTALTSGFVFKNDHCFKKIYGRGVVNILTFDNCYYPCEMLGVGTKISYWRATGHTDFLKLCTRLQQVPVTFYLRCMKEFDCLQLYASLGGGFTWIQEKSHLGRVHSVKGIGELEIGFSWPIWEFIYLTSAFRYLFPPQSIKHSRHKLDVGGCDLRIGIEFSF